MLYFWLVYQLGKIIHLANQVISVLHKPQKLKTSKVSLKMFCFIPPLATFNFMTLERFSILLKSGSFIDIEKSGPPTSKLTSVDFELDLPRVFL